MQIYLVGGAVRDKLINIPVKDKDWVVVGANVQEMLDLGFTKIGKDFPVFLHPKTKEEYALARTERKNGQGYKGFSVYASPDVTLEEDLGRRDLTINAIAEDIDHHLIDPYHGQADIKNKILRHVSPAFTEDPLRILRVARFAARFHHLHFSVAADTMQLMTEMVANGELKHLTPERIWQEIQSAFSENSPEIFITTLQQCNALAVILPEVDQLFATDTDDHPSESLSKGEQSLLALKRACNLSADAAIRFSSLTLNVGRNNNKSEKNKITAMAELCARLTLPNEFKELSLLVCNFHQDYLCADQHSNEEIFSTLEKTDAFRRPQRFEQFLLACQANLNNGSPSLQSNILRQALQNASAVKAKTLLDAGFQGIELGQQLKQKRIESI